MSDTMPKHSYFYIETITFRVQDCLFKVPREPFKTESTVFGDMFLLPVGDKEEGNSDDNPIHLAEIKKDEFELLIGVLLHRTHSTCQKLLPETTPQWVSVLKLATLWGFDAIRQAAPDHPKDIVSPAYKIVLGQVYDLDFESWTLPAMHAIVRRKRPISCEEAREMGLVWDTTRFLWS